MSKQKKMMKLLSICTVICLFLIPLNATQLHAAEYEIVFKAGAHGSLDGGKEVKHRLTTQDVFPNEPTITVEDGYVFKGWSKELPSVGSKVNQKAVYVAKYGVVINGMTYTVRYVDENKVDIATAKTMLGEKGSEITERAKNVPGYTYQESTQTFVLDEKHNEIMFIYTLTNPNEVIRYETVRENETTNQNANTQTNQQQNDQNNQTDNNNQGENINDNEQPNGGGEENIDNKNTPQARGLANPTAVVSIVAGALLIAASLLLIYKKKKKEKENVKAK